MKNGGPAYPSRLWGQSHADVLKHEGISIRDYFAAAALTGELAASANEKQRPEPANLAGYAYQVADAMLVEREYETPAAIDAPQVSEGEAGPITEQERTCVWKRTGPLGYYMGPIYQWVAGCCNQRENDRPRHDWCPWCGGRIRIEEREA